MSDKKRLINFAEEYDRIITEAARRSGLSLARFAGAQHWKRRQQLWSMYSSRGLIDAYLRMRSGLHRGRGVILDRYRQAGNP
jgi:hypothetical protein